MNRIPDALYGTDRPTWLIVGASRGIGLAFVQQLVKSHARVFATVREQSLGRISELWAQAGGETSSCQLLTCDVLSETSIIDCVSRLAAMPNLTRLDHVVLNAGVLRYPNQALAMSFEDFAFHLHTNAIGPIIMAQRLVRSGLSIGSLTFISSDSGSAGRFLAMEDGFAAYAASKAALNQALRHMAAELGRKGDKTVVLALHPGEVATDMQDIDVTWTVEGIISPEESVKGMIEVITEKQLEDSGTFWTWEGKQYPW